MNIIKNPAKSRPLSANVRRLMRTARDETPNPNVQKITRVFSVRDLAYCDMQGNIFMAAIDRGITMADFVPVYMTSQLAGVIDHSFSCAGGMENDDTSRLLQMPLLLKSPETIVDTVVWLNNLVNAVKEDESANMAVVKACLSDDKNASAASSVEAEGAEVAEGQADAQPELPDAFTDTGIETLADEYEYAYWLGYIYRYECLLHDESSRMVYGAFDEAFMQKTYAQMLDGGIREEALSDCAGEICRRLDMLLVGKLWKSDKE